MLVAQLHIPQLTPERPRRERDGEREQCRLTKRVIRRQLSQLFCAGFESHFFEREGGMLQISCCQQSRERAKPKSGTPIIQDNSPRARHAIPFAGLGGFLPLAPCLLAMSGQVRSGQVGRSIFLFLSLYLTEFQSSEKNA